MSDIETGSQSEEPGKVRTRDGDILSRLTIERDKIIFREGQDSTDVFIIESGRIGIFKTIEGKAVPLAVLEKGAMFGEMAAFTNDKRSATAMTLEGSVIVRIPKSLVMKKIAACDPFIKALIDILINNLNRVNERYVAKNQTHDKLLQELKIFAQRKPAGASAGG